MGRKPTHSDRLVMATEYSNYKVCSAPVSCNHNNSILSLYFLLEFFLNPQFLYEFHSGISVFSYFLVNPETENPTGGTGSCADRRRTTADPVSASGRPDFRSSAFHFHVLIVLTTRYVHIICTRGAYEPNFFGLASAETQRANHLRKIDWY